MPRFTHSTTPAELEQLIQTIITDNSDVVFDTESLILSAEECIGGVVLDKDIRGKFDFENVLTKNDIEPSNPMYTLMGPITLGHVTAQGFLAGQDYGLPFYLILYRDHNNLLRGYVPKKGNSINPLTKQPFGEGGEEDDKYVKLYGYSTYADMCEVEELVMPQLYDKSLLIHDITSRIQLKTK